MVVHGKLCPVLKKTLMNIAAGETQERTFGHENTRHGVGGHVTDANSKLTIRSWSDDGHHGLGLPNFPQWGLQVFQDTDAMTTAVMKAFLTSKYV